MLITGTWKKSDQSERALMMVQHVATQIINHNMSALGILGSAPLQIEKITIDQLETGKKITIHSKLNLFVQPMKTKHRKA